MQARRSDRNFHYLGVFSVTLTDLAENTNYYARPYAIANGKTYYGTVKMFKTDDTSEENGVVSGSENFDTNDQIVNTHPAYGKFIKQYEVPYDWRTPQNDALWNAGSETSPVKTPNDPCPAGWRVPTHTELQSLASVTKEWHNSGDFYMYNYSRVTGFSVRCVSE